MISVSISSSWICCNQIRISNAIKWLQKENTVLLQWKRICFWWMAYWNTSVWFWGWGNDFIEHTFPYTLNVQVVGFLYIFLTASFSWPCQSRCWKEITFMRSALLSLKRFFSVALIDDLWPALLGAQSCFECILKFNSCDPQGLQAFGLVLIYLQGTINLSNYLEVIISCLNEVKLN